jgi:hypothetical protein
MADPIDRVRTIEQGEPPTKSHAARIEITVRCKDADSIPKVANAGEVESLTDGTRVQIMHNGVRLLAYSYYEDWTVEVIRRCRGHHEPQEERIFYEVLKHISDQAVMLEVGAYWCYYSLARSTRGR